MTKVTIYESVAGQTLNEWTDVSVEVRETWSGSWEAVDYLQPLVAVEAASPGMSTARFLYRYGNLKREDSTGFVSVDPLELAGQFIRIKAIPGGTIEGEVAKAVTLWTGIIVSEAFDIHGTTSDPVGDQGVRAFGLEFLLDRRVIGNAWAQNDAGDEELEIGWAPVFNERYRRGGYELGNQGTAVGGGGAVFGGTDPWTHKTIAEYVLDRFSPPDLTFELSGAYDSLHQFIDIVPHEGLTPRQILDTVISPQRGYGWCVRVDDESDKVRVHVYTLTGKTITFGDSSLPANGEQASMAFDDARDIARAIVAVDEAMLYDEVHVLGARVRTCFTMAKSDGSMGRAWTPGIEDSYVRLEIGDAKKNDLARAEDVYWRVFQVFAPPDGWDWTVNGEGGSDGDHVVPHIDDDGKVAAKDEDGGNVDGVASRQGKAFLDEIPYERNALITPAEPEYLPPFAVVIVPKDEDDEADFYAYVERVGCGDTGHAPGYLRMVDREMAVHVDTRDNHELALNHWESDSGDPGDTTRMPTLDWETLLITVNLETDERLKVKAKIREVDDDSDPTRVLVVNVPDAHLWHVTKNTVTSLKDGQLQRSGGASQERDDSDRLRAIAAWCKGWYGEPRARVDLVLQKIFHGLRVGTYVTNASSSWHSKKVGTVVSRRVWSFGEKAGDRPSTHISTDYGEPSPALMG